MFLYDLPISNHCEYKIMQVRNSSVFYLLLDENYARLILKLCLWFILSIPIFLFRGPWILFETVPCACYLQVRQKYLVLDKIDLLHDLIQTDIGLKSKQKNQIAECRLIQSTKV